MDINNIRELYIKNRVRLCSMYIDDKETHICSFDDVFPEISDEIDNDFSVYRFAPNANPYIHRSKYNKPKGMYLAPSLYMVHTWAKTLYREREEERESMLDWHIYKYNLDRNTLVKFRLDFADAFVEGEWYKFNKIAKYNIRPFSNPYNSLTYAFSELVISGDNIDKLEFIEAIDIDIDYLKN